MLKYVKLSSIVSMFLLILSSPGFSQTQTEQLVITTYYPSPYGSYRQLTVNDSGTAANRRALEVNQSGAVAGTGYAIYATKTGASTVNVGGYFSASGGTANYALVVPAGGGSVGIGTATPTAGAALDIVGGIRLDIPVVAGGAAVRYNPGAGNRDLRRDLAELFDTNEVVEAGDVLCIAADKKLKKSNKVYDTSVAGIVSEAPAIVFEGSRLQILPQPYKFTSGKKPPVALAGRVLCKVTTSKGGPIKIGDLLVTSSKPGYAMRGEPNKVKIGTVLGKAMESLEKGEGKITVLATLQ